MTNEECINREKISYIKGSIRQTDLVIQDLLNTIQRLNKHKSRKINHLNKFRHGENTDLNSDDWYENQVNSVTKVVTKKTIK